MVGAAEGSLLAVPGEGGRLLRDMLPCCRVASKDWLSDKGLEASWSP